MARHWIVIRDNVHVGLGIIMIVCIALIVVTFPVALIWNGQPAGAAAALITDGFAWLFAAAFFAAFVLSMFGQRKTDVVGKHRDGVSPH